MANKRNLKKQVNKIAGILYQDCFVQITYVPNTDKEKGTQILMKILKMQDDIITRICHPEPGNVKAHFKKLKEDLSNQTNEIVAELEKLN